LNGKTEYRVCPITLEGLKEKIWVVVSKYNGILADKVIIKTY
jgi:septum formation topological specificity factor MinE